MRVSRQAVDEEQSALHVAIEMGLAGTVAKLVSFGANVGLQMKVRACTNMKT